jgi:PAS domain S-box-containing protein
MVVAVVVTSLEGIVESVNHSAEQIFGCSESELVGRHCLCLFGDAKFFSDTAQKDVEVFQKSLHQQFLNRVAETECKRQDGRIFAAELSMNKMEMADGERYILGILDVSNLRDAERSRKEFVSTVSHELRTPLTSIRGSLTLLTAGAMGALPDPIRKQIVVAERNVLRLIGLINDILDIEKLESGKLDMVFEDVNMASILERSFEAVKSFAEQHQVNLDIQPSDVVINADGDRLIQVLVNLMSNACKFSPKGETVTITVSQEDEWLSVKVIDRGRGIPEKFKKLLFQRFQQVEAADAKKKGGTGLGLAICKGLIEAHGGTIGVDSEEGEGSTFWFRVPQNQGQKSVHLLN